MVPCRDVGVGAARVRLCRGLGVGGGLRASVGESEMDACSGTSELHRGGHLVRRRGRVIAGRAQLLRRQAQPLRVARLAPGYGRPVEIERDDRRVQQCELAGCLPAADQQHARRVVRHQQFVKGRARSVARVKVLARSQRHRQRVRTEGHEKRRPPATEEAECSGRLPLAARQELDVGKSEGGLVRPLDRALLPRPTEAHPLTRRADLGMRACVKGADRGRNGRAAA